jgi:hypothetical protein
MRFRLQRQTFNGFKSDFQTDLYLLSSKKRPPPTPASKQHLLLSLPSVMANEDFILHSAATYIEAHRHSPPKHALCCGQSTNTSF